MLTALYTALRDRLLSIPPPSTGVPSWSPTAWIDLWNNQIDNLSEENPIRFPAVFIEIATDWQPEYNNTKRGTAAIKIYIVQETLGMDTYTTNLPPLGTGAPATIHATGQTQAFAQIAFIDTLNDYLQGYSSISIITPPFNGYAMFYPLENTSSRHDTNTNELRIDTLDYTCELMKATDDPTNLPTTAIITDTLVNPLLVDEL